MKSRILVIDDEDGIRDSMRRTLEYQGYEFIGAATGQEGLALIERDHHPVERVGRMARRRHVGTAGHPVVHDERAGVGG